MSTKNSTDHLFAVKPVAILVDGGFFLKRYSKCYQGGNDHAPKKVIQNMYTMLMSHVKNAKLYRILFYDCSPLDKKAHNPITNKCIDFGKSNQAKFRNECHAELKKLRKVALGLGYLKASNDWLIKTDMTKQLLNGRINVDNLKENDVTFDIRQKGVDMKIGLDIASLSYKGLVDRIILVSGDADFVPAAKLARREGIDFILDPMWKNIDISLHEHIDGLKSTCPKPSYQPQKNHNIDLKKQLSC